MILTVEDDDGPTRIKTSAHILLGYEIAMRDAHTLTRKLLLTINPQSKYARVLRQHMDVFRDRADEAAAGLLNSEPIGKKS
jgi:hypothetical protein